MRLEFCMPAEIETAKANNTPLVLAGGTVEYHGLHCAYGCDSLIAEGLIELLAKEREIITAPTVHYSPSSYAVADERSGTVHIEEDAFENYAFHIFRSFLCSGFRNIYVVIHHQFERENLMPMTLCYLKAAKKATMRYLEQTRGRGWWGNESSKSYYGDIGLAADPFSWIKVIPAMSKEAQEATGYDHAGKYETSILAALYPAAVDLKRLKAGTHWYTDAAVEAGAELGRRMVELSLKSLKEKIK
jgi:creatinine amidohydrolase